MTGDHNQNRNSYINKVSHDEFQVEESSSRYKKQMLPFQIDNMDTEKLN